MASNSKLYYALGAVKNVGFEAVANIIKERDKNGVFKSINDSRWFYWGTGALVVFNSGICIVAEATLLLGKIRKKDK